MYVKPIAPKDTFLLKINFFLKTQLINFPKNLSHLKQVNAKMVDRTLNQGEHYKEYINNIEWV